MRVNEKMIEKTLTDYLPFLATENLLMEAVKRGGDRQALHERIRQCTLEAARLMEQGEPCNLPARLAAMPEFGMTESEIVALLKPENYTGRCREQVETYLATVKPLLQGVAANCTKIEV